MSKCNWNSRKGWKLQEVETFFSILYGVLRLSFPGVYDGCLWKKSPSSYLLIFDFDAAN